MKKCLLLNEMPQKKASSDEEIVSVSSKEPLLLHLSLSLSMYFFLVLLLPYLPFIGTQCTYFDYLTVSFPISA